jgi:hypothetical protein
MAECGFAGYWNIKGSVPLMMLFDLNALRFSRLAGYPVSGLWYRNGTA